MCGHKGSSQEGISPDNDEVMRAVKAFKKGEILERCLSPIGGTENWSSRKQKALGSSHSAEEAGKEYVVFRRKGRGLKDLLGATQC